MFIGGFRSPHVLDQHWLANYELQVMAIGQHNGALKSELQVYAPSQCRSSIKENHIIDQRSQKNYCTHAGMVCVS